MKRLLFFVGLLALTTVFNACTKDKDPDPAVVGSWKLDRISLSGLSGDYASYNKNFVPSGSDVYTIKNDKTFTEEVRGVVIETYQGTWDFSGSTLNLKYDSGDTQDLTLDATKTPNELATAAVAASDTLQNPINGTYSVQRFTIQYAFKKQ